MKKILLPAIIVCAIAASAFTVLHEWKIDDKTAGVKWEIVGHNGTFSNMSAAINFDKSKLTEAKFSATIDAKSLTTDNEGLTGHLKTPEYFDTEKYPNISFTSTEITAKDAGYMAKGNLTMKDSTKVIEFPFNFTEEGAEKGVFSGTMSVNSSDFGVTKPGKKNFVTIYITVPVSK